MTPSHLRSLAPLLLAGGLAACAAQGGVTRQALAPPEDEGALVGFASIAQIPVAMFERQAGGRAEYRGSADTADGRHLLLVVARMPGGPVAEAGPDEVLFGRGTDGAAEARRVASRLPDDHASDEALPVAGGRAWIGHFDVARGQAAGEACTVRRERDPTEAAGTAATVTACARDAAAADALADAAIRDIWRNWGTPANRPRT